MLEWLGGHLIEVLAVIFSLTYLYYSIKQNILLWPFGIISVSLYIYVYFIASFYADMSLQVFYLFISIYGWYNWKYGSNSSNEGRLKIVHIQKLLLTKLLFVIVALWVVFYILLLYIPPLLNISPSAFPIWDAFTTAGGIIGTFMLAKKIIEHWIVWIVVDALSIVLYVSKGLYPTTILFIVYTFMAVIGYYEWKKELKIIPEVA